MASITGQWYGLTEVDFNALRPPERGGGFLHFREEAPWHTTQAVRQHISDLAATYGWPLTGIFLSGYGETPHFALHISEFPTQTGGQREEKLQNAIDAMLAARYEDVELGREEPGTFLICKTHVWNYSQQNIYAPRRNGVGDYAFSGPLSPWQGAPPANWWQDL